MPIVETYGQKMKCFQEPEKVAMWGNFDSNEAQNIQIAFQLCDSATSKVPCKSKDYIQRWMSKKFILVLKNENDFIKHKFKEDRMQQESTIKWIALTPTVRTEEVFMINRNFVELNDGLFGVSFLEKSDTHGFAFAQQPSREYSDQNNIQTTLTYELSQK